MGVDVVLSSIDRQLLNRCLDRQDQAWTEFVDRFLGLVIHVVEHSAGTRGLSLVQELREDLVAEVFASLIRDDFAILRKFRGQSSLATYLTIVGRRIVVRKLQQLKLTSEKTGEVPETEGRELDPQNVLGDQEQVKVAMASLPENEAAAVRMFYFEGKTCKEFANEMHLELNAVRTAKHRAMKQFKVHYHATHPEEAS